MKKIEILPDESTRGVCPFCVDYSVYVNSYKGKRGIGLLIHCAQCNVTCYIAPHNKNYAGVLNLRRLQRLLQTPDGRDAYIRALMDYDTPLADDLENRLPGGKDFMQTKLVPVYSRTSMVCPLCANPPLTCRSYVKTSKSFTLNCVSCALRITVPIVHDDIRGIVNVRRVLRMLLDERARSLYREALMVFSAPLESVNEDLLPGGEGFEQRVFKPHAVDDQSHNENNHT